MKPLKVLITSGGTKIPIDGVRHIANMSKGTFGAKIALQALKSGLEVTYLYAQGSKSPMIQSFDLNKGTLEELQAQVDVFKERAKLLPNFKALEYANFDHYAQLLKEQLELQPDIVILAAAVSDYGTTPVNGKIRTAGDMAIQLHPLPKLIHTVKELAPKTFLVGFKLLVNSTDEQLIEAAFNSIKSNKCDLVVANDLRDIKNDAHRLLLVTESSNKPEVKVVTRNLETTLLLHIIGALS